MKVIKMANNAKGTDAVLVKKPHTKERFTEAQLKDFAKCADPTTGPEYFMSNYFYIQSARHHPPNFDKRCPVVGGFPII